MEAVPIAESWVQPLNDSAARVTVPYLQPPSETWTVNADQPTVAGRRYPLGLVGGQVTNEWQFETVWPSAERPVADDFVALLKSAADSDDARLLVNIAGPYGGSGDIQFVAETHRVAEQFQAGVSTVSLTLTRVDFSLAGQSGVAAGQVAAAATAAGVGVVFGAAAGPVDVTATAVGVVTQAGTVFGAAEGTVDAVGTAVGLDTGYARVTFVEFEVPPAP